jgi:hypothetical protein
MSGWPGAEYSKSTSRMVSFLWYSRALSKGKFPFYGHETTGKMIDGYTVVFSKITGWNGLCF